MVPRNESWRRSAPVFLNSDHYQHFLTLLDEIAHIYGVEIHAYCLIGNHYHLIIHTPQGNLSQAMRHLNSCYTQYYNRYVKSDGPLFRGRYKAIVVSAETYLLRLSRYIHLNPIKANLVSELKKYQCSSYRTYLGLRQDLESLKTREVLKRFKRRKYKGSYKHFVEKIENTKLDTFYQQSKFRPVLGDDAYYKLICDHLAEQSLSTEIVGAKDIIKPPSLDTTIQLVSTHFDLPEEDIVFCTARKNNPARKVAILLYRDVCSASLPEIAAKMGNVAYTTVSKTIARAKADKAILHDFTTLRKVLQDNAERLQ